MNRTMNDSGDEWVGEIPEHWILTKIKNIVKIVNGKDNPAKEGTVPVYGSSATPFGFTNKIMYDKDTVLLGRKGTIDKPHFVTEPFWAVDTAFYTIPKKNADLKFFYYCMTVLDYKKYTYGSAIPSMSQGILNEILLPYPILKEQQKIAAFLDKKTAQIDAIIDNTKQSIVEFKKYKQALITETVTKGLNPDVKMKDSGIEWIGEIPEHWNVSRLRYLGTLQNGISKSGDAFGSGFPFLSYGDVYRDIELPKTVSGLIESSESDRLNYSVTYGDVLFTRTSETIEEVGFSSTCLETIPDVVFAGFVIRFRPKTDELSPNFSKYYFRSQIHRSFFAKEMNLVTRASLSQQLLKKLPVLLPSIKEQQQITDYLDEKCTHIDSLIADKEKLISEFEDYKKALIYEYVTGKKEVE